ncbi:MAG: hypothetical protein AB1640_13270 [bacterium]
MSSEPLDRSQLQREPVKDRPSKVSVDLFGSPVRAGMGVRELLHGLPRILASQSLLEIARRLADARRDRREIIFAIGGHVIKVGLNPVLMSLMDEGILTCLAMNGAGVIHDVEIALWGRTSEDVGPALDQGMFGVAQETAELINHAVREGARQGKGFGAAVAERLREMGPPFAGFSLLCHAAEKGIPVTVHVALGTDIVHMHPSADGGAIGKTSLEDFYLLAARIARLEHGVFVNAGSAVILPEVFVKALNLARNLGHKVQTFTTVNMDFIKHYRPSVNVVERPVRLGGKGYHLVGHHEINLPLLAAAVLEILASEGDPFERA